METGRKRKLEANQEEAPPKEEEKLQTTEQDLYLPNTSTLANSSNIRTPDSELRESNDHRFPTDLEKQLAMAVDLLENREFYRDRKELPPYSDIELMRQAIQESPKRRLPFKKIYNWIKDTFGYYRTTRYPQRTQNYLKRTLQYCDQFNLVRPNGQGLMWMLAEDFVALQSQGRAASLQ